MDIEGKRGDYRAKGFADRDAGERGHPHSHSVSGRGSAAHQKYTPPVAADRLNFGMTVHGLFVGFS